MDFVKCLIIAALFLASGFQQASAQLMINADLELPVTFAGHTGNIIYDSGQIMMDTLLFDRGVLDSLELSASQRKEVEQTVREHGIENYRTQQELIARGLPPAEVQAKMDERQSNFEASTSLILLPHQMRLLKMTAVQKYLKSQTSVSNAISNKPIAAVLGLSEAEVEALKAKSKEVSEKLKRDIEELKKKAVADVFSVLPVEKRKSIKDEFGVGEAFIDSVSK